MEENNNFSGFDDVDTIPEISTEDDCTNEEIEVVTPDNVDAHQEEVARDTDSQLAEMSVSDKAELGPFVSIQYNHKKRDFTKDEAIKFIQKGMHTEALRTKLEFLAKSQGTDVNSLVDTLISAPENAYKKYLENLYGIGHKNVEIGMKIYREKQSDEYKKIMAETENSVKEQKKISDINSRLAVEYLELKNQIGDAPEYSELPDSVIMESVQGKRDLYSAYLCYMNKEKQKIDAANKSKEAAIAASGGRMSNTEEDRMSSADRNFLSGLWSK